MKEYPDKIRNQSAEQSSGREKLEEDRVLKVLDDCLKPIMEKSESKRTERENQIFKSISDAKEKIEKTGENRVEIRGDSGEIIYSQAEGVPVDELIDCLEEKIKRKKVWINQREEYLLDIVQKAVENQAERVGSEDDVSAEEAEAAFWNQTYSGLADDDPVKRQAKELIHAWGKLDGQDYGQDRRQVAEAVRQAIDNLQSDLTVKMDEVRAIQYSLDELKSKSAKFSELHPDAWGDDAQRHKRIELEAHYISGDHRTKGSWQTNYELAEKIMGERRELVIPEIEKTEPRGEKHTIIGDGSIPKEKKPAIQEGSPTWEEPGKTREQEAAPSLRYLANYRKLKERYPDMPDEEIEEYIKYAETSEAGRELEEQMGALLDQVSKAEEDLSQEELDNILKEVADKTGIPAENVLDDKGNIREYGLKSIYEYERGRVQALAEARVRAATSTKKKVFTAAAKIGGYAGAGFALGVATGGTGWLAYGAAAGLGGVRVLERWRGGKLYEEKVKIETRNIRQELSNQPEARSEALKNILAQIATLKQKQIDNRPEGLDKHRQYIEDAKRAYLDNPSEENRAEFLNRVNQSKQEMGYTLAVYLEKLGVPEEQRELLIQASHGLYQIDEENSLLELREAAKKPEFFRKMADSVNKLPGSKWLRGGKSAQEKAVNASVFVGMGLAARELPVIRNMLMAYAGMKTGQIAGNFTTGRMQRYDLLKQLRAGDVNRETINVARAQLQDKDFKHKDPDQYALMREAVDRHEEGDLREISQAEQDRAERLKEYLEKRNSELEDTIQKRHKLKQERKVMNAGFQVAGAAVGWLIGDQFASGEEPGAPEKPGTDAGQEPESEISDKSRQAQELKQNGEQSDQKSKSGPEGVSKGKTGSGNEIKPEQPTKEASKSPVEQESEEQTDSKNDQAPARDDLEKKEEAIQEAEAQILASASSGFEIADNVSIEKGDSIWTVAEKHLNADPAFKEIADSAQDGAKEALATHNIDRIKDVIAASPTDYGLSQGAGLDRLSVDELRGIDWQKAFNDAFKNKGFTDNLSQDQVESIIQHNNQLKQYFTEHPESPRTSEMVERIISGKVNQPAGGTEAEAARQVNERISIMADRMAAGKEVQQTVYDIFSDQSENLDQTEWGVLKGKSAADVLAQDFGSDLSPDPDFVESSNRLELLNCLREAQEGIGPPRSGQTVQDYMTEYQLSQLSEGSGSAVDTSINGSAEAGQTGTVQGSQEKSGIDSVLAPQNANEYIKNSWDDIKGAVENNNPEALTGISKGRFVDPEINLEKGLVSIKYPDSTLSQVDIDFGNRTMILRYPNDSTVYLWDIQENPQSWEDVKRIFHNQISQAMERQVFL